MVARAVVKCEASAAESAQGQAASVSLKAHTVTCPSICCV